MEVEPMTTDFRSDALTDRALRPWVQLEFRAKFIQLHQFHRLFSVQFHYGSCLRQSPGFILIEILLRWSHEYSGMYTLHIYIYIYIYVYIYVIYYMWCVYIYIYIHIYACIHMYIYIYTYVCIYNLCSHVYVRASFTFLRFIISLI